MIHIKPHIMENTVCCITFVFTFNNYQMDRRMFWEQMYYFEVYVSALSVPQAVRVEW
jgi:hypothetical protein